MKNRVCASRERIPHTESKSVFKKPALSSARTDSLHKRKRRNEL